MWKGSLTRITVFTFALLAHAATAVIDSPVERPWASSTTAFAGTPRAVR